MYNDNKTVLISSHDAGDSLTNFKSRKAESPHSVNSVKSGVYQNLFSEYSTLENVGDNPYIALAKPLFRELDTLLKTYEVDNVKQIHENLKEQLEVFTARAAQLRIEQSQIMIVRYILCTFLDELICTTYWGKECDWANGSLLNHFYQETYGGEKFFQILGKMLQNPASHIHILEYMYICIALGFEGKYRIMPTGKMELESIRENLYKHISAYKPKETTQFYIPLKTSKQKHKFFYKASYLKVATASLGIILLGYGAFTYPLLLKENALIPMLENETAKYNIENLRGSAVRIQAPAIVKDKNEAH